MADSLDYPALLRSWGIHLRAERKSASTIKSYTISVQAWLNFCEREGIEPVLDRPTVNAFVADLLDEDGEAGTARVRQLGVRRFSAWLTEEGEVDRDELLGLKPPKLDDKVVEPLTEDECKALVKACSGKRFVDRRDEAIVRLLLEGLLRAGELLALDVDDLDIVNGAAIVRRGKGFKGRSVPFGPQTGRALDRYLRSRRTHKLAEESSALWLADRRGRLGYWGLRKTLRARAAEAGIENFHPHRTRTTGATRWLAAGGSEGSLMAIGGWSQRRMMDHYVAHTKSQRAAEESRRLNLGDL